MKGVLPLKTIARRYLHMTETEIAEMIQDAQDTSFLNAMAQQNAALDSSAKQTDATMNDSYLGDGSGLDSFSTGSGLDSVSSDGLPSDDSSDVMGV